MGTIADELKRVMTQWDTPVNNTNNTTTAKETTVNTTQPTTKADGKPLNTKDKLMIILRANPGITGVAFRDMALAAYPDIPDGSITSTVTQLAQQHYVTRKPTTVNSRATFFYYPVDDATRKALVAEEERQLKLARARAEKARAAKALKATRVERDIPVGVAPAPEPVQAPEPVPIIKSTWDAKTALEGISVLQARELYIELKNIFGN